MVEVIDTSVAIKWFVKESGQEAALEVLKKVLETPDQFAVPELFYFELSHVFHRLVPKPNAGQLELFHTILTLGIYRFAMTADLYQELRPLQSLGLSGYDAAYVALAKLVKGKWITFDAKAHAKIARFSLSRLLA